MFRALVDKNQSDDIYKRELIRHYAKSSEFFLWEKAHKQYLKSNCSYEELMGNLFNSPIWKRMQPDLEINGNKNLSKLYGEYKHYRKQHEMLHLNMLHNQYLEDKCSYDYLMNSLFGPKICARIKNGPQLMEHVDYKWHLKYPDVVLTSYFTSKADPQTEEEYIKTNHYSYIEPWYDSMQRIKAHGVIFYDKLSDEFIRKYTTEKIKFVKCRLGRLSMNDERFIIYLYFLLHNKYNRVFVTDITDVVVNKTPFDIVRGEYKICVGRDRINLIKHSPYIDEMIQSFEKITNKTIENEFYNCAMYNAGIIGAKFNTILYLLALISKEFFVLNSAEEHDMMILSYMIYKYFHNIPPITDIKNISQDVIAADDKHSCSDYVISGFPLCSEFFKYQFNSEAYFIHK